MTDKENKSNNEHSVDPAIIRGKFTEISGAMLRIEAEKELIKEIIQQIEDITGQEKKIITKAAKMYHNSDKDKVMQETDEVIAFHDKIIGITRE